MGSDTHHIQVNADLISIRLRLRIRYLLWQYRVVFRPCLIVQYSLHYGILYSPSILDMFKPTRANQSCNSRASQEPP